MIHQKRSPIIITSALAALVFFVFPIKTTASLSFLQDGKINLVQQNIAASSQTQEPLAFSLQDWGGYVDPSTFQLIRKVPVDDFASYSNDRYYDLSTQGIFTPTGSLIYSSSTVPYFHDNKTFNLYPSSGSIVALNEVGEDLWDYSYSSYLTDIDISENYVLLGYVDGALILLSAEDGSVQYSYNTDGSQTLVTYAVALSKNEDHLIAVTGLNPQRFILFTRKNNAFQPSVIYNFEQEQRKAINLGILDNLNVAYLVINQTLYFYSIENNMWQTFPLSANFIDVKVISLGNNIFYAIHNANGKNKLVLLTNDFNSISEMELAAARHLFLDSVGESSFLLGLENRILKFNLEMN